MAIMGGLPFGRRQGLNFLASPNNIEPSALTFKEGFPDVHFIPALLIWRQANETIWLIFDCPSKPSLAGRVFRLFPSTIYAYDFIDPDVIQYYYDDDLGRDLYDPEEDSSNSLCDFNDYEEFVVHGDWICFLHEMWKLWMDRYSTVPWHDYPEGAFGPDGFLPDKDGHEYNPAPLWSMRDA